MPECKPLAGSFWLYSEENAVHKATGRESQSNEFPELEPFKMAAEELIEYLPYIYHPKIDTEHEKSYQKVKKNTYFAHDNKNKCQIKRNNS